MLLQGSCFSRQTTFKEPFAEQAIALVVLQEVTRQRNPNKASPFR